MPHRIAAVLLAAVVALIFAPWSFAAAPAKGGVPKAPAKASAPKPAEEPDDGIQGEYAGTFTPAGQNAGLKADAKVIGEGGGTFRVVLSGGEGEKAVKVQLAGKAEGKRVALEGMAGDVGWKGTLEGGAALVAESKDGKFNLKWSVRKSPTEGAKPPAGAVVLLPFEEGKKTNLDAWRTMKGEPAAWEILDDGSVRVKGGNIQTKQPFGSVRLHVEFCCPYMPTGRGQGRGNSGVYQQSRYECQVLDSFGLPPKDNECGGLYSVAAPKEIASLPPGRWQTYDITFKAPKVQDGKIVEPAVMSVVHNGIRIHENVKIDHVTTGGVSGPVVSPAPLMLQDHGNPVRYRNIWLVELKD
jgi:hypothetical protein